MPSQKKGNFVSSLSLPVLHCERIASHPESKNPPGEGKSRWSPLLEVSSIDNKYSEQPACRQ